MAKKNRSKCDYAMPVPMKEKPKARFDLGKEKTLPKLRVGSVVEVTVRGRVTNLNDDEWSRSFSMTIQSVECDGGMGGDMDRMHSKRRY